MKSVSKIIFSIGVLGLISACGPMNSADPTRGYKDVETVAPHDKPNVTQGAATEIVTWGIIDESGEAESPLTWKGNFIAGQAKSFKVLVSTNLPNVTFDLSSADLPEGMSQPQVTETPGVWIINWTPSAHILPNNRSSVGGEFHLEAVPHSPNEADIARIKAASRLTMPVSWNVDAKVGKPKIDSVTILEEIKQDEPTRLQIKITDPSSSKGSQPNIAWDTPPAAGSDTYDFNANGLVSLDPAQPAELTDEGTGTWVFNFIVDPRSYRFPTPSETSGKTIGSAIGRLSFHVVGVNRAESGSDSRTFKINRSVNVEAPRIDFGADAVTFLAGKDNSLKILADGNSSEDEVAIDGPALQNQIKDWPGNPTVLCSDSSETGKGRAQCTINWKIPCIDANLKQSYSFSVQSVNSAYGASAKKSENKSIRVEKNEAYCPSPKGVAKGLEPLKVSAAPQAAPKPEPEDLRGPNTPPHVEFSKTQPPKPRPASPGAKK